ncbi:hypothetical protein BM536_015350 [Streptomyces phaeoluteigriseus]|uniref:Uncharacterized protein n=1 Tax=Streptomyces phaeoluteigriseus TaxID=114686 RepID=A0A1V6MTM3_9ACTN|nr:hypothetical protein BM536_015350 [Streptomyces phaeoluteigriseus]
MRHTVRRSLRRVEQAMIPRPPGLRAGARTVGSGTAPQAPPARLALVATRIPQKVPEQLPDSGP